jgi:hypothetical protein
MRLYIWKKYTKTNLIGLKWASQNLSKRRKYITSTLIRAFSEGNSDDSHREGAGISKEMGCKPDGSGRTRSRRV